MTAHFNLRRSLERTLLRRAIPGVLLAVMVMLAGPPATAADTIDINSATAEELAAVMTGVGLKKAMAIVADRDENGPFATIDDLVRVSGIGSATVDTNRNRLSVTAAPAAPSATPSE